LWGRATPYLNQVEKREIGQAPTPKKVGCRGLKKVGGEGDYKFMVKK
jgi:hypothetical protein